MAKKLKVISSSKFRRAGKSIAPVGQLGPGWANIMEFCKAFNAGRAEHGAGMPVPGENYSLWG